MLIISSVMCLINSFLPALLALYFDFELILFRDNSPYRLSWLIDGAVDQSSEIIASLYWEQSMYPLTEFCFGPMH